MSVASVAAPQKYYLQSLDLVSSSPPKMVPVTPMTWSHTGAFGHRPKSRSVLAQGAPGTACSSHTLPGTHHTSQSLRFSFHCRGHVNGMVSPQWLNRPSHGQLQASRVPGARSEQGSQRSLALIR